MYNILISACLFSDPQTCTQFTMKGYVGDLRIPYTCMIASQDAIKTWKTTYGKWEWQVTEAKCLNPDNTKAGR